MDLQEIYKKESGYDVGKYNIDNTNYYSEDYVEWLEKQLRIGNVVGRREQLVAFLKWVGDGYDFENTAEEIVKEYIDEGN